MVLQLYLTKTQIFSVTGCNRKYRDTSASRQFFLCSAALRSDFSRIALCTFTISCLSVWKTCKRQWEQGKERKGNKALLVRLMYTYISRRAFWVISKRWVGVICCISLMNVCISRRNIWLVLSVSISIRPTEGDWYEYVSQSHSTQYPHNMDLLHFDIHGSSVNIAKPARTCETK